MCIRDRGIPFVIFLGEDEINAGVVAVKDMESGEQVKVSLDEAAKLDVYKRQVPTVWMPV